MGWVEARNRSLYYLPSRERRLHPTPRLRVRPVKVGCDWKVSTFVRGLTVISPRVDRKPDVGLPPNTISSVVLLGDPSLPPSPLLCRRLSLGVGTDALPLHQYDAGHSVSDLWWIKDRWGREGRGRLSPV